MEGADVPAPGGGSPQALYIVLDALEVVGRGQGHPLHGHLVLASLGTAASAATAAGERGGEHLLARGPGRPAPDAAGELEVRVRGEVYGGAGGWGDWGGGGGGAALGAGEEVVVVVIRGGGGGVGVAEGGG